MTENLKTGINDFILDAALKKEPVFDAFRKLCELQDNPNMNYVDFEWKYYQYYHGNRDLAIERNSENSSPVTFSGMTTDVIEKVVGELDLVDCLRLRKVSHDLRNLVDEIRFETMKFVFAHCLSGIVIGNSTICYSDSGDDGCTVYVSNFPQNSKQYNVGQSAQTAMLADASAILKNPKLKIRCLEIDASNEEEFPEFVEGLKSLNIQLNARSFHFSTFKPSLLPLFQLLKPKALEKIKLDAKFDTCANRFDGIEETEQWKMAKKLYWETIPEGFLVKNFLHFKEIRIVDFDFSDNNLIMVRDTLLKSAHLESCHLKCWPRLGSPISERTLDRIISEDPLYDSQSRRFSVPNSNDYFQLEYGRDRYGYFNGLTITKISKN